MSKHIETLKLALEALEKLEKHNRGVKITTVKTGEVIHPAQIAQEAITAIKEALAQPEQEPVGVFQEDDDIGYVRLVPHQQAVLKNGDKLYTTPPQRKPLTDEQIAEVRANRHWLTAKDKAPYLAGIRDAETAHGIKE